MYWSRTGSIVDIFIWLLLSAFWWLGGWLLAAQLFRVRSSERLVVGLGLGLVLEIVLSNVLGQVVQLSLAYWAAALLILISGILIAWRNRDTAWFQFKDLKAWPQLAGLFGLTALFTLIGRGLAIFDDYHNLPLVSTIAAGDFPPHFYLNPQFSLAYHYGLHLFTAILVRIAGFFPWSALDLTKALTIAMTVILFWVWIRRVTRSDTAAYLGSFLLLFGGGSRWLMLFLPQRLLTKIGSSLELLGSAVQTGHNLYRNLGRLWVIEGAGPVSFPFAYVNGIFYPLSMSLGGSGALPWLTILLLLLCFQRSWTPLAGLIYGLVLSSLALTSEIVFVIVVTGLTLALLLQGWRKRNWRSVMQWGWVMVPAIGLGLVAGGVLTGIIRSLARNWFGWTSVESYGFAGFAFQWPPVILSAHLGKLSLANAGQALLALMEMGPIFLMACWSIGWGFTQMRRRKLIQAAFGLAVLFGFVIPLVLDYQEREREISRLIGSALMLGMMLGFPLAWFAWQRGKTWGRTLLGLGFFVGTFGGLVLFSIQLIAISRPQLSYFVAPVDSVISQRYWNRLPEDSQVIDRVPFRAVTLFGNPVRSSTGIYEPLEDWKAMIQNPNPAALARANYSFVYLDEIWWEKLSPESQQAMAKPCVKKLVELSGEEGFRRLLDVRACQ
ncbi:MAG: hypothetical protein A2Z45_00935 [Chloroflexi bacterium RBG_19FT_COMBO_55_16]|nr:MAG: hypothetical protein A2Z45_00935 [Chloroflexi bacterium RBG_19FT_COMBO_55_16]